MRISIVFLTFVSCGLVWLVCDLNQRMTNAERVNHLQNFFEAELLRSLNRAGVFKPAKWQPITVTDSVESE